MWQFSQLSSRVRTKESEHIIGGAAGFSGQQMMKGGEEVWGGAKEVWKTEGERTSRSVAPEEARAIRDRCVCLQEVTGRWWLTDGWGTWL